MKEALILLIPLWCANGLVNIFYFFRKKYNLSDYPLDGNRVWSDGAPILGPAKTILGLPITLLGGYLGGILVDTPSGLMSGLAVYLGAIASGFVKRRLGIVRGEPLPIIDQADYLLMVYPLSLVLGEPIGIATFGKAMLITIPVHLMTNIIAYYLGIREKYW